MTSKLNLANRAEKARAAARFVGTIKTAHSGGPRRFSIPGSDGHRYQLALYIAGTKYQSTCWSEDMTPCRGNSSLNHTVCYHTLAAIDKLAADNKCRVAWCATTADMHKLARLAGGKLVGTITVQSKASLGKVYGVVSRRK